MGKNDYLKDRLTVNNFTSWDREFRCLMYTKGVLKPEALQSKVEFATQDDKDGELRAQLMLNTEKMFHPIIDAADTGLAAYQALKKLSEDKDKASKVQLQRELNELRMKNSECITEYAARTAELKERLVKIGTAVDEDDLAMRFLQGLPGPYATFRQIHMVNNRAIDMNGLLPALLKMEMEVDKSERIMKGRAMHAREYKKPAGAGPGGRYNAKNGKRGQKETRECFYCGKTGHLAAQCHKKQRDERAGNGGRAQAHAARGTRKYDSEDDVPWIVDSGSTHHIVRDEADFESLKELHPPRMVTFGDGTKVKVTKTGTARINVQHKGRKSTVKLAGALLVPTANMNLMSLSKAENQGLTANFAKRRANIRSGSRLLFTAPRVDDLYVIPTKGGNFNARAFSATSSPPKVREWHQKLGHPGETRMHRLVNENMANGIDLKPEHFKGVRLDCEGCAEGKMPRKPFPTSTPKTTEKLELVHMDLAGPFPTKSLSGNIYVATYLDDFTGYSAVRFLKYKSQVTETTISVIRMWENQTDCKVKIVRSDNGGEYVNTELETFYDNKGILHQTTVAYTPEQNGKAERLNRTLAEPAVTMLHAAKLPKSAWEECYKTSCYLRNRLPTTGRLKTPFEMFCGEKPDLSHLEVIGARVYAHVPADKRKKLDKKSDQGRLVGYDLNSKAYRVLLSDNRTVIKAHTIRVVAPSVTHAPSQTQRRTQRQISRAELKHRRSERKSSSVITIDSETDQDAPNGTPAPIVPQAEGLAHVAPPNAHQLGGNQGDGGVADPGLMPGPDNEDAEGDLDGLANMNIDEDNNDDGADAPTPPPSPAAVDNDPQGEVDAMQWLLAEDNEVPEQEPEGANAPAPQQFLQTPQGRRSKRAAAELANLRIQHNAGGNVAVAIVTEWHSDEENVIPDTEDSQYYTAEEPTSDVDMPDAESSNTPGECNAAAMSADFEIIEPNSADEAMKTPQADEWKHAMDAEMASLLEHNTWTIEDMPQGAKSLPCRWCFKVKRTATGKIERFKARLVAKGFKQVQGIDFEEVFAPVSKHTTMRYVLSEVAARDLELKQADVGTAFLNGELEEPIWMDQPPHYASGGPAAKCKLHKTIYGLKQAPRAWYAKLNSTLSEFGLSVSDADPGLYHSEKEGATLLVLVYVDDLLIAGTKTEVAALMQRLKERFTIRDLGDSAFFLGMEILRDRKSRTLALSQRKYTRDILKRFEMQDCKPRSLPMAAGTKIRKEGTPLDTQLYPYAEAVGSLMYLAVCTRPDISFTVGALARHMSVPTTEHWSIVKGTLQYLQGTTDWALHYKSEGDLAVYTDSDYSGDVDTRRSTAGMVTINKGGAISWYSKVMSTVALSTTEAEYMAATLAAKEGLWLEKFSKAFGKRSEPVRLYGDNQGALKLAKNPIEGTRSKHIDVQWHFLRQQVNRGNILLTFTGTASLLADALTKCASTQRRLLEAMGLHSLSIA